MSLLDLGRAEELLAAMRGRRLLVLGDLMLDEYRFGEVERISPEAPVPIVRIRRESVRLGGAGNVAANAAALGAIPLLVGVLGSDPAGERFRAELARLGLDDGGAVSDASRPTTVKSRVIAHSQQVVRCDREETRDLDPAVEERVLARLLALLPQAQGIVVSDYAKGLLTPRLLKETFTAARAASLPVVVNPTVRHFALYQPVTALTPNHHQATEAAGVYGHDDDAVLLAGRRILERLDTTALLITRGEAGMTLFERDGHVSHIPTMAREVYDVAGAGDTVSTVFTLALAAGGELAESAAIANHAAGVVVAKVGTATASPEEVLASLRERA